MEGVVCEVVSQRKGCDFMAKTKLNKRADVRAQNSAIACWCECVTQWRPEATPFSWLHANAIVT